MMDSLKMRHKFTQNFAEMQAGEKTGTDKIYTLLQFLKTIFDIDLLCPNVCVVER